MPMISVIVPVYKVEKYLRRCVNSLLNQDYDDYEIILVDDGSPDGCPQICDEYANDERIRVIHKENGGLSDARNVGTNEAQGDYIIYVDSDDYVDKNHISSLWKALKENNADISCSPPIMEYEKVNTVIDEVGGNYINNNELFKTFAVNKTLGQEMILYGRPVGTSAWSKLIKKEYCLKHPFPKGKVMEELATTFYLLDEASMVAVTGIPTYHYVQRQGSILHSSFSLNEIDEYMALAEKYVLDATTDSMKAAAAAKVFLLGRRLGCSVPEDRKKEGYRIINSYCRKYLKLCLNDPKASKREKVRALMMGLSNVSLRIVIDKILVQEKRRFDC